MTALVPCIAISTGFVLLTCFICEALRKIIEAVVPEGLLKTALKEFVAGAELCGCGFELIIIADNYGVSTYAIFLFSLTIWWAQHWGDATACPYLCFEDCINGSMTFLETAVRTIAATIGGVAVFGYIQILWNLEVAETHVGRSHSAAWDKCSADLAIPVLHGCIVEGVATLLCRLTSKFLSDKEPQYSAAIDSFVATSLVVAGFNYSGGYYNPVLATGLKMGCRGHSHVEFGLVYWLAASIGAIASIYVYPVLKNSFGIKAKTE